MAKSALIDLVNAALVSIGQEPVVSLDNTSTVSATVTAVNAKVDICRRKLLRLNDWNCARRIAKLPLLAGEEKYKQMGWKYVFKLPTQPECLRVVQISIDGGQTYIDLDAYYNRNSGPKEAFYDIDDTYLLCNSPEVFIKYTADIDVSNFDPSLASAFVAQLASELAYCLPASVSLADYMLKVARQELKTAKSVNARERNILHPEGEVISIRYGGTDRSIRVDMSDQME